MPKELVSGESLILWKASFSSHPHMDFFHGSMERDGRGGERWEGAERKGGRGREKERDGASSSSKRTLLLPNLDPTVIPSFNLNYLLNGSVSKCGHIGS